MLSDPVTGTDWQAARLLMGLTMVGFLVARLAWRRAPVIQYIIAGLYLVSVLGFILYYAL